VVDIPGAFDPEPNNLPIKYGKRRPAEEERTRKIQPTKYHIKYGLRKYIKLSVGLFLSLGFIDLYSKE